MAGHEGLPALSGWLDSRDLTRLDDASAAGEAARELAASGAVDLPLSGSGRTRERLRALALLGAADLVLARLVEGHVDAVAILAELGAPAPGSGDLWGVWAADPPTARVTAALDAGGRWRLRGTKGWCSGATTCSHALVTAHAPDGYRLFALSVDGPAVRPVDGTWSAVGMAGSDSRSVELTDAVAVPVGGPQDYLARPGFWHGGVGVAAVWLGGARGVAEALAAAHARRPLDDHAAAHAGGVDVALLVADAVLDAAAAAIDDDPLDRAGGAALRAARTRAAVERSASEVLDRVGRALGAAPLALDRRHARRVADLTVYLRQSHAERDLASLGRLSLDAATSGAAPAGPTG